MDLTRDIKTVLKSYTEMIESLEQVNPAIIEKYHLEDMMTADLAAIYSQLVKMNKKFSNIKGIASSLGRLR